MLSFMHNSSLVINAARGRLIDLIALYDLVHEKNIYAALDVFDVEPLPTEHPLLSLQNVIATHHIAAATVENYKNTGIHAAQTIIDFFEGKAITNLVN
ncbi:hypothetical protein LZP96_18340 [Enterobacteriaceae bacterium 155047]|nr:hypothetical protein [Huaxiibacter chinensis]